MILEGGTSEKSLPYNFNGKAKLKTQTQSLPEDYSRKWVKWQAMNPGM
jgi:hypothetical protein